MRELWEQVEGLDGPSREIGIFINRSEVKPKPNPHRHVEFLEISYVVDGSGVHILDGEEYPVSKGDLFVINFECLHEFRAVGGPLTVYNVTLYPEFLDPALATCRDFKGIASHPMFSPFFGALGQVPSDIRLTGAGTADVETLFESMLIEYDNRAVGYEMMLKAKVIELLTTIFRLWLVHSNRRLKEDRNEIVERAIAYIKKNYEQKHSISSLAGKLFVSPSHLSRLFKHTLGMSVTEYIQKVRIDNACRLLRTTTKPVADIMVEVGYSDIKHFNSLFKRQMGQTASQYRESMKRMVSESSPK